MGKGVNGAGEEEYIRRLDEEYKRQMKAFARGEVLISRAALLRMYAADLPEYQTELEVIAKWEKTV